MGTWDVCEAVGTVAVAHRGIVPRRWPRGHFWDRGANFGLEPAAMWPRFLCGEHDGEGWEATVEKVRSGQGGRAEALVAFVARRTRGAGWKPMWLQLSSLRPLR